MWHAGAALAVVPAFGVDTFVVAAGLGASGALGDRRVAVAMAASEGLMPVAGAALGGWVGGAVGRDGVWAAAAVLAALGIRSLIDGMREGGHDDRKPGDNRPPSTLHGGTLLVTALSVGTDELIAGVAAGAARLPLGVLAPALALQAVVFTCLGLRAGSGLRRLAGRYGEIAGGAALCLAAGAVLLLAGP